MRECSTGRIQRRRSSGVETRSSRVMGAASTRSGAATIVSSRCWTMWTEKSVVSKASIGEASAMTMAPRPASQDARRQRGTGVVG